MSIFRRPIIIPVILAGVLAVALLAGRNRGGVVGGQVEIVYAHPPCPPFLLAIYERIFDEFRRTHPHIKLTVQKVTSDYERTMLVRQAGQVAPDIVFMYPMALASYAARGAFIDLKPLIDADPDVALSDYYKPMIDAFTYKGKVYGLPKDASAPVIFYNKDMFDREGVEYPNPSWTWDDFLRAAKKLTKTNARGRRIQFGTSGIDWPELVWQNGGELFTPDMKHCLLDSPEAIEAIQWKADLTFKHHVAPTPIEFEDRGPVDLFETGKIGMFESIYPIVAEFRAKCDFEWDIALLPKGRCGRPAPCLGSAYAITTQCKHPKEAFEFVKFITGMEGMLRLAPVELASYKAVASRPEFLDPTTMPRNKQAAADVMQYARPLPQSPRWAEITAVVWNELDLVWRGKKTAEETCRTLVPKVDKLLAEE